MLGIEWLRPAAFLGSILYALIGVFCAAMLFVFAFVTRPKRAVPA